MSFLINSYIFGPTCSGDAISTTSLAAYYKFDGNATDSSGNGLNGTATSITYSTGKYGDAAYYNGTTSTVSVADNALLEGSGGNISVFFWCNANDLVTGTPHVAGKWTGSAGWRITPRTGDILLTLGAANIGATVTNLTGTTYHIGFTYNNNTWIVYRNGVQVGTGNTGARTLASANAMTIGSLGATSYWNGWIDEVNVWQRVLSASEVAILAGSCPLKS